MAGLNAGSKEYLTSNSWTTFRVFRSEEAQKEAK